VRKTPALLSAVAVAAVLAASLVGCSASGSAACTPAYASGAVSRTVKATATTATFPTPLVAKTTQVSVNTEGTGGPIQNTDQVDYTVKIYNGKTGEDVTGDTAAQRSGVVNSPKSTSLNRSLMCAKTGSVYTLVSTVKDAFGKGAGANAGFSDDDTLVIVVDVKDHFLGKANGINQLPRDGMPNVITAVDGQPGIVIQELDKPKDLMYSTIKAGSGAVVKKGATVHLKYTGWTWPATGDKPLTWDQSTWDNDKAADIPVKSTDDGGSLPPGMYKALLGAKVGSQVLVVMPPKDGFASGSAPSGVAPDSTVIMVIDVLGIA